MDLSRGGIGREEEEDLLAAAAAGPDDQQLEAFKINVRDFLALGRTLREAEQRAREVRATKRILSGRITEFMRAYNIEDLHTPECRLRYNNRCVRQPLPMKQIVERLTTVLSTRFNVAGSDIDVVCEELFKRETKESESIRRLPMPRERPRVTVSLSGRDA